MTPDIYSSSLEEGFGQDLRLKCRSFVKVLQVVTYMSLMPPLFRP